MDKLLLPFRQSKMLNTLYLSNIFISFHYALIIYLNSSFLANFFSDAQVSSLYIIGSIIDMILLVNASRLMEKIGIYKFTVLTVFIELIATVGMVLANNQFVAGLSFLVHLVTISLILFNMDVYIEEIAANNPLTGSIHATYLTVTNITIVLAPSLVALLLIKNTYSYVYIASALFIIPLFYFVKKLKKVEAPEIRHIDVRKTLTEYVRNKDLYNIFISQFLLQLFYAYMVIYVPIYLSKYVGFSWSEIGLMFTIMLLPFVLFELPVGELADEKYGEKEFLTIGFIVMGLATFFISFVTVKVFWVWAIILFITRIGASFTEISTESYFFKHADPEKTDVISFFRITRPLSFVVAPLLASLTLQFIPSLQYIFIFVGATMILGTHYSLALNDTK